MLVVRVVPNSSKTEIVGWMADGSLKIKLAAPPVDGKANQELIALLAKACSVSKQDVEIINGLTTKKKTIRLPIDREAFANLLTVQLGIDEPAVQPKMF